MNNKIINYIALTLVIIGAVIWGLIGFFNINLLDMTLGDMPWLVRIIYALVGISGLYLITFFAYINARND